MKQQVNQDMIVLEHKGEKYQPAMSIVDEKGEEVSSVLLTSRFILERC